MFTECRSIRLLLTPQTYDSAQTLREFLCALGTTQPMQPRLLGSRESSTVALRQ
jgi:hypothetical protein